MGRQIRYIEPLIFIYMVVIFYAVLSHQQLVYRKVCLSHYNQTFCDSFGTSSKYNTEEENLVQEETTQWDMYNSIAKTLPAIVSTIFLGAWSDGVGRKKVLMIAVFGETINAICLFINAWLISAPVFYLLIGNVIAGICGNYATILMVVFAYIADVTTLEMRTIRITLIDALAFVASVISYLSGGVIIEKIGFVYIYGIIIGLYSIMIIYIFFLKESYYPTNKLKLKDLFLRTKIMETIKLFTVNRRAYHQIKMFLLTVTFSVLFFQIIGINTVTILFVLHKPLNFHPSYVGYLLAEGSAAKFVGACLVGAILIKRYKWHDYSIVLLHSIMTTGFTLCLGLSRNQWQVYVSFLWCLGMGVGISVCQSSLSKMVSAEEQGKMNSVIGILQMFSTLVGTIICNVIYKATIHITPSFTFYVITGLLVIPILFSSLLKMYEWKTTQYGILKYKNSSIIQVSE